MTNPKKTKAKSVLSPAANASGGDRGAKTRRKAGRPTLYTAALGEAICTRIAGGETLTAICLESDHPSRETVWRWMQAHTEFEDRYLKARVFQMGLFGDEALDIAKNEENVARARCMIDARRVNLSRLGAQYGPLIAARAPQQQPFSFAEALTENRRKIEALVKEIGHVAWKRQHEDETIQRACEPPAGYSEEMVRGTQRVAMHILEERKRALLTATPVTDKPN